MKLGGVDVAVSGRLVRIGRVAAEGFQFVEDPEHALETLAKDTPMDLFTFVQPLPVAKPRYRYPMEWDNVAALPVSTFEHWWSEQINGKTRNMVRRSAKMGLVFREVALDEALVKGIWEIYNETPVRQTRPFPHYGKSLEEVWRMSATFLDSSIFIGAFLGEKLVGFVKLTIDEARSQAAVMNFVSLMAHKDKAPTNGLIAEAVKACETRAIPYLVYSKFSYANKAPDSLSDFKARNGFRRVEVARYYVPLTRWGALAFRLGLQHGVRGRIPQPAADALRRYRDMWYEQKSSIIGRRSL
jgi:hypothetical protein